ncbi:MAG: hypothetical protein AAGB48_13230 [Planctomycetota bacterium]
MTKNIAWIAVCLTAIASGCISSPEPVVERQLNSWTAMRDAAVASIAKDQDGKRWRVEPIRGVVPEIGDMTIGNVPGALCDLGETRTCQFQPLPRVVGKNNVDVFAGLPIPNDLLENVRAEAGFKLGKTMSLAYSDMTAEFVDDTELKARIVDCLKRAASIAESDLRIVRGIVSGRIAATYGDLASANANVKILKKDAIRFSIARDEGYELIDEQPRPQFQIVAVVNIEAMMTCPP